MHWIFKFPLAERANLVLVSVGPVPLLFIHLRKRDCVDFNCGAVHKIAKSTNESRQKGEKDIAACLHSHACTIGPVPNWAKIKLPNDTTTAQQSRPPRHLIALRGFFCMRTAAGWQFNRFFDRLNHGLNHLISVTDALGDNLGLGHDLGGQKPIELPPRRLTTKDEELA